MHRPSPSFSALLALSLVACVSYRPRPADAPSLAAEAATPPSAPLSWEAAVRWAMDHDPDLLALRARVSAAASVPPGEPIEVEAGTDNAKTREAMVTFDALSILGLGPRRAELALAAARRSEALAKHHEKAREVAVALAEAYVVEEALLALVTTKLDLAADAYVRAGLEPAAAKTAADAAGAKLSAEASARATELAKNRLAVRRLLGAREDAAIVLLPGVSLPADPSPRCRLANRADVQRALATYEVADHELAKAVAAQWPGLVLSPGVGNDPTSFFGHVGLRLPFGASSEARAAECAREAARHEAQAVVLDALSDAARAAADAAAARTRLEAARQQIRADDEIFRAANARIQATGGSYLDVVVAGGAVVSSASELREATVEEARARVRAAAACGWPGPVLGPCAPEAAR